MAQIEVFQRDRADVIVIGNLNLVFIFLGAGFSGFRVGDGVAACPGFRPVAGFHYDIFRENVLLLEQHLKRSLYFIQRPFALMQCRENRDQHIGVMFNIVQIEVILVVVVSTLIVVQILLQLGFHITVGRFRTAHIRILWGIGTCNNTGTRAFQQHRTGGQTV